MIKEAAVLQKFQSTPLHERRPHRRYLRMAVMLFQSTPLHERRRATRRVRRKIYSFNPRLCMRGDLQFDLAASKQMVSIHASA